MSIDSRRLTKDCESAQAALAARGHVLRRTGATAVIEPILPLIREFRTKKYSWVAIAAALAKQGVVQGSERKPITARRLTALISAINKRERHREDRFAGRARRRDLTPAAIPQAHGALSLLAGSNRRCFERGMRRERRRLSVCLVCLHANRYRRQERGRGHRDRPQTTTRTRRATHRSPCRPPHALHQ